MATIVPVPLRSMAQAFLVRDERAVIVDSGPPGSAQRILLAASRAGVAPGDVALIVITHGHSDHSGSAAELKRLTGAPVAIGAADAGHLRSGLDPAIVPRRPVGRLLHPLLVRAAPERIEALEPDIEVSAPLALDEFGVAGQVLPIPGHTPGSLAVFAGDEAIVGDTIMGGLLLRRRPGFPMFADDPEAVYRSVRSILAHEPRLIHAGHGGPFTAEAVGHAFADGPEVS